MYTGTKADKKRALEASDIGTLVRGTEMDLSKRIPSSSLQKAKMLFVFMFIMQNIRANTLIIGANNNPINKKVRLNADFSINYKKTALLFAHL